MSVFRKSIEKSRESLRQYEPFFRIDLRLRGASVSPSIPTNKATNTTLKTVEQYKESGSRLQDLGLHHHPDSRKNWDHLIALSSLLEHTDQSGAILDAGGEKYSPLVEWLYIYGYRDLHVLNLAFHSDSNRGPIKYKAGDITNSNYESERFDAITSLSVIEHGVDIDSFLEECSRLLRSDGYLIVSTDFWEDALDHESVEAYGMPWEPFTPDRLNTLIETAESYGFSLTTECDMTTDERTIEWQGKRYTFIILEFKLDK